MTHDAEWDELLDTRLEIEALDEQHVFRALAKINRTAEIAAYTLPADLQKPLRAIMAYAQEAQNRLIDG